MNELLSVKNLSITFTQYTKGLKQRKLKVINDLTLDVNKGEIVAILGSSGSGKSLLAHTILGILPENSDYTGEIYYKGKLLTSKMKEELRGSEICLIPQSVNYLDPLMKVSKQAIGHTEDEEDEKRKKQHQRKVFDKYGLNENVDNMYPFELSGGMTRKVLISTALLSNPELIVADEPTPGLDNKSIKETIKHIKNMKKEEKGVLLITHDINVALETADKIAIFYSGYVIEINKKENFSDWMKLLHPYTKALIKALPENGFKLTEGIQPLEDLEGCIYYENCPDKVDKCRKEKPELIRLDDIQIRCHCYMEKRK